MDPEIELIVIPVPAVNAAATGSLAVVPINNCPAPKVTKLKGDAPCAIGIPCAVGLETPVPPQVAPMVVPFHVPVVIVPMEDNEDNVVTAVLTKVPDVGN